MFTWITPKEEIARDVIKGPASVVQALHEEKGFGITGECGTTACIAGHMMALFPQVFTAHRDRIIMSIVDSDSWPTANLVAEAILSLCENDQIKTEGQARILSNIFFKSTWPLRYTDRLGATGTWPEHRIAADMLSDLSRALEAAETKTPDFTLWEEFFS